jgi:nitrile hydratase accessory protein
MSEQSTARPDIAVMKGAASLPRKSGEMVFHDDWERRAFAIAVRLAEQGVYDWSEFQQHLIQSVAEAERDDPLHPSRGYYESWLAALEGLLRRHKLLAENERHEEVRHGSDGSQLARPQELLEPR